MSFGPDSMVFQQSEATAAQRTLVFHVTLASDHISNATGKTMVPTISKAGGAFASPAGAVTELTNGWYKLVLAAADLDTLGCLGVLLTEGTSDPVRFTCQVGLKSPYVNTDATLGTPSVSIASDMGTLVRDLKTRGPIAMGTLSADGQTVGIDVTQSYDTTVTVTGTFGSGTIQLQTCADPTAGSPVWVNVAGATLTSNGSKTVTGPVKAIRASLSGSTSPNLVVTALTRAFVPVT
jgi:hypothetical protein